MSSINLGESLARGREVTVHVHPEDPNLVVKVDRRAPEKINLDGFLAEFCLMKVLHLLYPESFVNPHVFQIITSEQGSLRQRTVQRVRADALSQASQEYSELTNPMQPENYARVTELQPERKKHGKRVKKPKQRLLAIGEKCNLVLDQADQNFLVDEEGNCYYVDMFHLDAIHPAEARVCQPNFNELTALAMQLLGQKKLNLFSQYLSQLQAFYTQAYNL